MSDIKHQLLPLSTLGSFLSNNSTFLGRTLISMSSFVVAVSYLAYLTDRDSSCSVFLDLTSSLALEGLGVVQAKLSSLGQTKGRRK